MYGEPAGGGGRGGRGRRAVGAGVGRRQLHPRQRLHHAAPRLPAGEVAPEAPPPPPRRVPARARVQGPLQRHRRGQGGDRGDGGGARGDGGGHGEPARRHHARRRPPRQELPIQGAEPVQQSPEPGLQGARRPAARHGAGRLLERRAHPDRDRQLAHTTAKDPVPDVHASPWRDMEKIEEEKVMPAAAAVRLRTRRRSSPLFLFCRGNTTGQAELIEPVLILTGTVVDKHIYTQNTRIIFMHIKGTANLRIDVIVMTQRGAGTQCREDSEKRVYSNTDLYLY